MSVGKGSLFAALFLLTACGGGGAEGHEGTTPGANGPDRVVSEEAAEEFEGGNALFARYEQQGWNEQRCNETVERFTEAAEAQEGGLAEGFYMAGLVASRCNNLQQAQALYERAVQVNPRFCRARAAIGLAHMEAGREQPAAAAFQEAIRQDAQCTEAYVNLATIQRRQGGAQVREALNNLRRALAIDSNYLPAFNQMALLYLEQAEQAAASAPPPERERGGRGNNSDEAQGPSQNQQMLDLAGVVCRQAQLIDGNYAPIYNTWGLVFVKKGEIRRALEMFARALSLDDDMFEAHMNFGQITLSFRGYEDARNSFTRAVALQPRNYDAHIGLGVALRGLTQVAEAEEQYNAAIQLDGNRPEAYYNLGVLYQDYRQGSIEDLNRAKAFFQQFLQKAGNRPQLATTVQSVTRTCQGQGNNRGRRRRRAAASTACRNGRIPNIDQAIEAQRMMADAARNNPTPPPEENTPAPPPNGGNGNGGNGGGANP